MSSCIPCQATVSEYPLVARVVVVFAGSGAVTASAGELPQGAMSP